MELIFSYKLVQVDREKLERDASVVPESERIEHVDNVHSIIFVLVAEVLQYTDLLLGLSVEPLLVAHHLERAVLSLLVVIGLHDLAEAALPDHFEHLVPVRDVVVRYVDVGALFVVVLAIVREAHQAGPLLRVRAYEVHLGVVVYLAVFVRSQFVHVKFHDLFGAGCDRRRALVGRLRGGGRRRRPGLQRRQSAIPQQRAPERVRAPQRHVTGHGRAAPATASTALARRGRELARTTHCTSLHLHSMTTPLRHTVPHLTYTERSETRASTYEGTFRLGYDTMESRPLTIPYDANVKRKQRPLAACRPTRRQNQRENRNWSPESLNRSAARSSQERVRQTVVSFIMLH